MASAWGRAWGAAWGSAWGGMTAPVRPTASFIGMVDSGEDRGVRRRSGLSPLVRRKRSRKTREREEHLFLFRP